MKRSASTLAATAAIAILAAYGQAAFAASYYDGKTIEISVDRGSGGSQDRICRFMASHLATYIEGKPKIVVRNRPGGTGVVATNWLYDQAPKDGTALGCFLPIRFYQDAYWGTGGKKSLGLKADVRKLVPVAGTAVLTVTYVRSDVGGGIKAPTDLKGAPFFKTGGQSITSTKDISFRTIFDLAGIRYNYVTGYQDSADAWAAVLRNEVQQHQSGIPHYMKVVLPTGVNTGKVTPLYYSSTQRIPELAPAIPAIDFVKKYGGKPEGMLWDLYQTSGAWRAFFLPPGTPEAAARAFESGFQRMLGDAAFRAAYKERYHLAPEWIAGRTALDREMVDPYRRSGKSLASFKKGYIDKARKK